MSASNRPFSPLCEDIEWDLVLTFITFQFVLVRIKAEEAPTPVVFPQGFPVTPPWPAATSMHSTQRSAAQTRASVFSSS